MRQRSLRVGAAALVLGALAAAATGLPAVAAAGAWSQVAVPNPDAQFTSLLAVDARTDGDAWIAGYLTPPGVGPSTGIALHWNGTSWASTAVPLIGLHTRLWGVSAAGASDVWAVGSFSTRPPGYSIQTNSLALHWNGSAWSQVAVPNSGVLYGVAAISANDAWASGGTLKHWDGTAWTNVAVPAPAAGATPGVLYGISARASNDVWAVGNYSPRRHVTSGYSVHYDGTVWTAFPTPAGIELWSVTTIAANDAWAVGQVDATGQPAALHWNGTAWTRVASPAVAVPDVWAVGARATSSRVWAVGSQSPGVPLVLERH